MILSRFLPFSPPVHQKIPHGFSTNLSRRVPKNERRLRYLLSLCFSSLSHPSSSGLSSRVPSFSSSGHNLLVFWNVASRPMGGGKINPTRLVVTCGKLLFYLSGGYWMLLGLNPKKKHSDALVIPCSILQVVDFSMGKKKHITESNDLIFPFIDVIPSELNHHFVLGDSPKIGSSHTSQSHKPRSLHRPWSNEKLREAQMEEMGKPDADSRENSRGRETGQKWRYKMIQAMLSEVRKDVIWISLRVTQIRRETAKSWI